MVACSFGGGDPYAMIGEETPRIPDPTMAPGWLVGSETEDEVRARRMARWELEQQRMKERAAEGWLPDRMVESSATMDDDGERGRRR